MGRDHPLLRAPATRQGLSGAASLKYVGDRLLRKEDPRLLTGRGRYVGDLSRPGMAHVAILRSSHAHARILAPLDTTRARRLAGVLDVVTFADLGPAARALPCVPLHPALRARNCGLLAGDRVRFVGEPVAAIVATSRYLAEDARDLIAATYEPLPSVQDPSVPTGARVHDDIPDNIAGRVTLASGNVEAMLADAPRRASVRLSVARGGGQPMETRGVLAEYNDAAERLTVWASSQVPHQIRQFIAELLGLPLHRIDVIAPDVGGGFGAKLIVYPEDVLVPFLAMRLGRPVRWLEDRVEHMLSATQERGQTHEVTVAFTGDGRLLAVRDDFVHDNGAYTPRGLVVPLLTASMLAGPYRIPAVEVTFSSVYTNRVPVTPYRGAGQPQAVFVIERVLDLVARETGRDRAEVRLANLVRPDDMPYDVGLTNYRNAGHVVYDSGDFPAVLRHTLDTSRYRSLVTECARDRAAGRLRGVGVACYVELTGVGPFESATVRVESSGRILVFTGVTSQGQGLETTLAQVCAGELGVTPDDVTVVPGDTSTIGQGVGTFASRAAVVAGTAVALAARDVRARAHRVAAALLDAPADELEQQGPRISVRADPGRGVTFAQLAAAAGMAGAALGVEPGLDVTRHFQPPDMTYSSGAHVALLEIDPETGTVTLQGHWIGHDSGRLINPMIVEGQIQGGAAVGLGSALLEEVVHDDAGQPLTATYMDYLLPTATDVPAMAVEHLETPSPLNPLGVKGVGESGTLPVAAVIASAIEDALGGVRVTRVPLTLARIAQLLSARRGRGPAPN